MLLIASLAWGAFIWIASDTPLALVGAVATGSMTLAMLAPWKQRHNPSGEDPVVYRGDRAVDSHGKVNPLLVSTAGTTLNPVGATYGRVGGVVPYVVVLIAGVFPLVCALSGGPAEAQRIGCVILGWAAFATMFIRHIRREVESDSTVGRGVPL